MDQARRDWREHRYGSAVKGFIVREWPILAWLLSFVMIGIGILQVAELSERNRQLGEHLQDSLVEACVNTRTPVSNYFVGELRSTLHTDPALFGNPDIIQRLIDQKANRIADVLDAFDPRDCATLYGGDGD